MSAPKLVETRELITAAANGIGRSTALAFALEGADAVATDIDEAGCRSFAARPTRIKTRLIDVTDAKAVEAALWCAI